MRARGGVVADTKEIITLSAEEAKEVINDYIQRARNEPDRPEWKDLGKHAFKVACVSRSDGWNGS